ncbi:MAG: reverse transcriptase family protein, partial [Chloroflexota bacterium]
GLEFVSSMVSVKGQSVPCILRNITTEPVTIPKRSEIAQLEVGVVESPLSPPREESSNWRDQLDLSSSELSESEKSAVLSLLSKYENMLDGSLGFTTLVEHHIDTGSSAPIRFSARRVPPFLQGKVKAELDRMVKAGILEENFGSYWGSPICIVHKKDGSVRICADLRKINAVTKIPAYAIPRVDSLLDSLGGNSLFCVLDLKQCYYQIGLSPSSRDKSTVVTPFGSYRHKRLCLGLNGAPMTCARLLDLILRDLPKDTAIAYFDDILLGGKSFPELLAKLELVLKRLKDAGLTINLGKCALFQKSVKFLGHVVSAEGVSVDPSKVETVKCWPVPRTVKQLATFLGMASYMRKHVKDFALIAAPLPVRINR